MKKIQVFAACAFAGMSLALNAKDDSALAGAFADLEGDDQVSFVATVNRSMSKNDEKLNERRIRTLYRVNRDAVKATKEAERKAVLAEVFATAPKECLPYFTEKFAKEVFNRKAAGFGENDDSFVEFASAALMRISLRCRTADNYPGTRSAYAVIMFLMASEGKPSDLREALMMYIHTGTHKIAREKWIPAALGDDGKPVTLQPIDEAGILGEDPEHHIPLPIQDPAEEMNRVLGSNLRVKHAFDVSGPTPTQSEHGWLGGDTTGSGVYRAPRAGSDPDSPWYRRHRGDKPPSAEPQTYIGQGL